MKPVGVAFFVSAVKVCFVLNVLFSLGLAAARRAEWLAALWLAFLWIFLNGFLFKQLTDCVVSGDTKRRGRVFALCLVKFPVLYLVGAWLLLAPFVRLEGVFLAFTAYLLAMILLWFGPKGLEGREGRL